MAADTSGEYKIKLGESVSIPMKSLSTAGYEWTYDIDGDEDCIKISKDRDLLKTSTQKNIGISTDEIYTITAVKKGEAIIQFSQKRSWEKDAEPVDTKTTKIIVE